MRKKFTMLLMSLLAFVGVAKAQWSNRPIESVSSTAATELVDGYYVIYNNGRGTFLNAEASLGQARVTWPTSASYTGTEALNSDEDLTNASGTKNKNAYVFYANVEGTTVSLQNGYGNYIPALTSNTTFNYVSDEAFWNFAFKTDASSSYVFLSSASGVGLDCNGWGADSHTYSTAAGWNADGSQSVSGNQSWTFYPVVFKSDVTLVDLVINYTFGGNQVKTETVQGLAGSEYTIPALDFTSVASCAIDDAAATEGATIVVPDAAATITVELEANLPFVVSTDYNSATWYVVQNRTTKYMSKTNDGVKVSNATPTTEDALWAFVGDPFTGITVLNKAAGAGFTLANDNGIKMKDGEAFVWNIYEGNGGFMLREGNTGNNYIHNVGGGEGLGYWDDNATTTDNGSAFVVTSEADMISLATTAMGLASKLDTYAEASYYTYSNAAVAEAKATLQGVAEPTDFLTALNAKAKAEAAQKILNDAGKSGAPVADDFIILKNKGKNEYMTTMDSGDEVYRTSDKNNPKALWKVVAGDDSKVKLYNVASEKYLGALSQSAKVLMVDEANAAQFTFSNVADVYAAFTSGGGSHTYAHMDGWYDRVVGWEAASDASQWIVSNVRPLSVVYKFNDEILRETTEYVEYGTVYTVSSPYTFTKPGVCTKNDVALEAVDGVFSFEVTEATTLIVELADALPFKTTTITEGQFAANTEWYVLRQSNNNNYWVYNAEGAETKVAVNTLAGGYDVYNDNQLWCFTGNAIDGVKVFNKAAGAAMSLDNASPATLVADNEEVWEVHSSTKSFTEDDIRFALGRPGKTGQAQYANLQGNSLKAWTLDAGSTTNAISVSSELAAIAALKAELAALITKVTAFKELVGTASAETLTTAIATAQAVCDNNQAYKNEVEDQIAALTAAADAVRYITNLDDLKNTVSYTVYADTRGAWYSEDERLNSTHEMSVAYSTEDTNQQFAFLKSANTGKYYLYSVAKGKFVKGTEKDDKGNAYTALTETPEEFISFLNGTNAEGAFLWVVALNGNKHIGVSTGFSPDVITHYNATGDQGNKLRLEVAATFDPADALAKIDAVEAAAAKVELAARIAEATELAEKSYINAEAKAALTAAKETAQGVYDDATATYAAVLTQITTLTGVIDAAGYVTTVEGFSNNAIYTFLSNRNETAYMMYDGENDFVASQFKQTGLEVGADKVNCQWAVYKSKEGNYYMYNLGAQKFMGTETEANTGIPFAETPQATNLKFVQSTVDTHPIMISANGGAGAVNHSGNAGFTNNYGIVNWNGGLSYTNDAGNVHKVAIVGVLEQSVLDLIEATVATFEIEAAAEELEEAVAGLSTCLAWMEGGYYTSTDAEVTAKAEAIYSWKANNLETATIAEIKSKIEEVNALTNSFSVVLPAANKYYRISHETEGVTRYIQAVASNVEGKENALVMTEDEGAASIFYYDGSKLLSYSKGLYLNESSERGLQSVGVEVVFSGATYFNEYKIKVGNYLHANKVNEENVYFVDRCGSDNCGENHHFTIEEVAELPLTIGSAGYSTFYTSVAVEIPAEVTASVITAVENGMVVLSKVTGVVPAATGLILEGNGEYNFAIATEDAPAEFNKGLLKGTAAKTLITAEANTNYYVLAKPAGAEEAGLYKAALNKDANGDMVTENGVAFHNGANKAYLPVVVEVAAEAPAMFSFGRGEGTTSIENAELATDNAELVIYDLTGRRVEKMVKGIYIVNGKKVLVK